MKLFLIFFFFSSFSFAGDGGWNFVTEKKGIKVYSKDAKKSPIQYLRAEGIMNASLENIVGIMRDVDGAKKWVPNLKNRSYVKNISDTEAILYDISLMPWPVLNRDMVVHHKLSLGEDGESLVLNFKSTKVKGGPKTKDTVRATIHKGTIEFYPKEEKTFIRMTILVDPNGSIPKWVVNLLQVKLPFEFLDALNNYAAKMNKKPLPGIQLLVDQIKANRSSAMQQHVAY